MKKIVIYEFIIKVTGIMFHKIRKLYFNKNLVENSNTCIVKL